MIRPRPSGHQALDEDHQRLLATLATIDAALAGGGASVPAALGQMRLLANTCAAHARKVLRPLDEAALRTSVRLYEKVMTLLDGLAEAVEADLDGCRQAAILRRDLGQWIDFNVEALARNAVTDIEDRA